MIDWFKALTRSAAENPLCGADGAASVFLANHGAGPALASAVMSPRRARRRNR
jgi:hypothetical protein